MQNPFGDFMNLDIFDENLAEGAAGKDLNGKLVDLRKKILEREQAKAIMLPEWPDYKRGTPNSFLRSALFSAVQSKDRAYKNGEILYSQQGILIKYTGQQLNQDDLTLWETLVHLAKQQILENVCEFSAYKILKSMRWATGKAEYTRLELGITRLMACVVHIKHEDTSYLQSLIENGKINELTGHYCIRLNRVLIKLYGDSNWTAINWEQRLQLGKKPLAQFLHGYYSSHNTPFPVKVATLHKLSGSAIKQMWKFKQNLKTALDELIKIGFLESYSIDGDLVTVKRK